MTGNEGKSIRISCMFIKIDDISFMHVGGQDVYKFFIFTECDLKFDFSNSFFPFSKMIWNRKIDPTGRNFILKRLLDIFLIQIKVTVSTFLDEQNLPTFRINISTLINVLII